MSIELSVTVVAPDEQLQAADETYCTLRREIELPYPPFIGLRVALHSDLAHDDPHRIRYGELFGQVSNPTAIFEIRYVYFFQGSRWGSDRTVLEAVPAYEPEIEKWRAYIQFLVEFYGFQKP